MQGSKSHICCSQARGLGFCAVTPCLSSHSHRRSGHKVLHMQRLRLFDNLYGNRRQLSMGLASMLATPNQQQGGTSNPSAPPFSGPGAQAPGARPPSGGARELWRFGLDVCHTWHKRLMRTCTFSIKEALSALETFVTGSSAASVTCSFQSPFSAVLVFEHCTFLHACNRSAGGLPWLQEAAYMFSSEPAGVVA